MSQLGVVLQESLRRERESGTSLGLLTEQMDAVDRAARRKRSLKERLGFTGIGCCGATWGFQPPAISVSREQHRELQQQRETQQLQEANPGQAPNLSEPDCVGPTPASSGMNLAAALAAERQFRAPAQEVDGGDTAGSTGGNSLGSRMDGGGSPATPRRVSLMRLLEETEGGEGEAREREKGEEGELGNDWVCCVCMGRKKGAAFIPCGHTYCRVCSRELWLNRGCCPLCNGKILEILDIF